MAIDSWFIDSREAIHQAFGDDYDLMCRLLAATSPISTIETNVVLAVRAYRHLNWFGSIPRGSFILTHYVCINKFLNSEWESTGRKIWSLYQNLIGNEDVCPIDRWILRFFGFAGDTRVTPVLYDDLENRIKAEAAKKGISPSQRQVEIWCLSRAEGSSRGYTSYGDIIKRKELTKKGVLVKLL